MMNEPKKAHDIQHLKLLDLLAPEQETQLARLLAELMAHKWGTLEIEIVNGKIRFFGPKHSIQAQPPGITLTK